MNHLRTMTYSKSGTTKIPRYAGLSAVHGTACRLSILFCCREGGCCHQKLSSPFPAIQIIFFLQRGLKWLKRHPFFRFQAPVRLVRVFPSGPPPTSALLLLLIPNVICLKCQIPNVICPPLVIDRHHTSRILLPRTA